MPHESSEKWKKAMLNNNTQKADGAGCTVMKCQAWLLAVTGAGALAGCIFNGLHVGNESAACWALCAALAAISGAGTSWRLAKILSLHNVPVDPTP